MHSAVYGTCTKVHQSYPDISDKQTGWLGAHNCISINRPRRTDTRRSSTLVNTDDMENRLVIGNRGGQLTFRNWGDIGLSPASQDTTQTNKPPKQDNKTGGVSSAVLLKKRLNITNGPVIP